MDSNEILVKRNSAGLSRGRYIKDNKVFSTAKIVKIQNIHVNKKTAKASFVLSQTYSDINRETNCSSEIDATLIRETYHEI